jgi:hypothetical protein
MQMQRVWCALVTDYYMYITLIRCRVKIAGRIVAFQRCDVTVQFVMCVVKYSRL